MSFLPVGVDVGAAVIAPDGKSVLLVASAAGQQNLYTFSLDELSREDPVARQLTSTPGGKSSVQWSPDGKEVWYLQNGRINVITVEGRATRQLAVTAEMDVDFDAVKLVMFDEAYRFLRDGFHDSTMNGVDWDAVHAQLAPWAAGARTGDEERRVIAMMIGELNASHSGVSAPFSAGTPAYARAAGARLRPRRVRAERPLAGDERHPSRPGGRRGGRRRRRLPPGGGGRPAHPADEPRLGPLVHDRP